MIVALVGLGYSIEESGFDVIIHARASEKKVKKAKKSTPKIEKTAIKKTSKANKTKSQ